MDAEGEKGETMIIDLSHATEDTVGPMLEDMLADLTYACYAENRRQAPDITPERWGKVFGVAQVEAMERRYAKEASHA